ncbi:Bug family tripartite tricarboxylate transporter substrate binding protein [Polynucleobacter brandtiae]|uniref:Tripartite-type tricarboxylate transporter receptor subunit TctC n=1 Tax=Polynucleobacter brandtiae TaxID=1938816 RepID=A0A2M8VQX4_9BURK|nr:tripartite tricarboxylate transporter substrate binding protein [Polynucleobacter brandtiae]PJI79870.1 tripartite-type tricarboxylate transporter receptor subunit TctC [Polynucleobacter brandtiae]
MSRILKLIVISAFSVLCTANAFSQSYPSKAIKLVVPFPPGGLIDTVARLVAAPLSKELNQAVIVDNKPGAGGNLGAAEVAKAPADGYTLLMASAPLTISPALYKNLPYTPGDIQTLSIFGELPNVLLVNPESGINTVADLVKRAKTNPGNLNYASNGNGTSLHLSAELLKNQAGIYIVHIPYRGSALANVALMSKEVDFMYDNLPPALGHIKAGKLKALAVTTAKRSAALPDTPTMQEAGYPGFSVSAWFGLAVPKGTPPEVNARLQNAIEKVSSQKNFIDSITKLGASVDYLNTAQTAEFMRVDSERWKKVVNYAKIQLD